MGKCSVGQWMKRRRRRKNKHIRGREEMLCCVLLLLQYRLQHLLWKTGYKKLEIPSLSFSLTGVKLVSGEIALRENHPATSSSPTEAVVIVVAV